MAVAPLAVALLVVHEEAMVVTLQHKVMVVRWTWKL
jgi:hypothetical protein